MPNSYIPEISDFNDEFFYFEEDRYYDSLDYMQEEREKDLEHECNIVELTHTLNLLEQLAQDTGLTCDTAVAALQDFISRYERIVY